LDGALSLILEHPKIRSVGFLNRRHYNIRDKKVDSLIEEKNNGEEYKSVIELGKYQPFRSIY
jgi:hypothetical protein